MILGSRGSPLALWQTNWVRDRLIAAHPDLDIAIQIIRTTGDRQQQTEPGPEFGGDKGIFVKEIEEALLESLIDAAVHSLKDLPTEQPEGLVVSMWTEPSHRRRGLGNRVMDAILQWCRARGIRRLTLHASTEGRPLYERFGFRPTNEMRLELAPSDEPGGEARRQP